MGAVAVEWCNEQVLRSRVGTFMEYSTSGLCSGRSVFCESGLLNEAMRLHAAIRDAAGLEATGAITVTCRGVHQPRDVCTKKVIAG